MKPLPIAILFLLAAASTQIKAQSGKAQSGDAPYIIEETGRGYNSLQKAMDAIGNRTGTILLQPGIYEDCGVQRAGNITYRATEPGKSIFNGVVCEGKAALVLDGRGARVDGIIFQNMAVPDGNGAGIRLQQGNLNITRSIFRNSEQGILTATNPKGLISIDRSTFSRLGRCDRDLACAHSIYIGDYGALTVTNSRFEKGSGGHYIKSRTARVDLRDNAFDDTQGRTTNYMIDLPAGSSGEISGNIMVQGQNKENFSAFIAVGAEDQLHSSARLSILNNDARIAPNIDRDSVFLANWTADRIPLGSNRLGPRLKPYEQR